MGSRFGILALSGGGFLGLYTIALLAALEKKVGAPIASRFDLLAGTSVGGIVALGLAAEIPAPEIQRAFEENGTKIFSDRAAVTGGLKSFLELRRNVLKPKYQTEQLRRTIIDLVGENTLLGDLKHPVIVPAVNLTKGCPQIFKTPHHETFSIDLHYRVVDVALATSAAPTFFPVAQINDSLFADGGLYANAPELIAVHEATQFLGQSENDLHVLSIGTTTSKYSFAHANGRQLGIFGWFKDQRLVSAMIAAQQQSVEFMMRHRLRDRYVRLDAYKSKEQEQHLGLDVATLAARSTIRGLAEATFQSCIADDRLTTFLRHEARAPVFFN